MEITINRLWKALFVFQEKDEFQHQQIHGLLSAKIKGENVSLVNSKVVKNLIQTLHSLIKPTDALSRLIRYSTGSNQPF